MLTGILVVVLVLIVGVLGLAATKPDTFRVERSIAINAPPEKIFPLINDFHAWTVWSPYEKLDPAMKRTYSGPDAGKGATYAWDSSGRGGQGGMVITDTSAPTKVALDLNFTRPMVASNKVEFTMVPDGGATNVTWAMFGPSPYMTKVMHVFFPMDSLVGKDFESGLAALKAAAEK
jgi:hypothetical protein